MTCAVPFDLARFELHVVRGDGSRAELAPGHVVYLWAGDDRTNRGTRPGSLRAAFEDARDELLAIVPDGVCVHGSPSQLLARGDDGVLALDWVAREIRALLPGVRLWVGVGGDGWAGDWRAGKATESQVLQPLQRVAAKCREVGAEAIVWNFETAWKHSPSDKQPRSALEALARKMMALLCALAPLCIHVVSSFDHVGFHMAVPFAALLDGNVAAFTEQTYVAVAGTPTKGVLSGRIASAHASQDAARRQGKFPADSTSADGTDDSYDDVDVFGTVQLYGTDVTDLTRELVEQPLVQSWSVPLVREGGRADEGGIEAARAARAIRNVVGTGKGAVRRYQQWAGLTADGVPGPKTRAHALGRIG